MSQHLEPESGKSRSATDRHPAGLWVLFITEMWERFSYYGMRGLLVLYLIAGGPNSDPNTASTASGPGFAWEKDLAYNLYGYYTFAVYITPILGGWLADRFLGTHRSLLVGGWIIAAGHVTLACTEFFGITPGNAVTLQSAPGPFLCFMAGLALIVIGTGFFKPCVSVMVGQLYGQKDPRRDSGFTIFYMGINLGALLAPLVAGTLGEKVGWHWGFGAAAVGMLAGLAVYQFLRPKYLGEVGLPPQRTFVSSEKVVAESPHRLDPDPPEIIRDRLLVVLMLAVLGNVMFWAVFEQAGSSLNVFAEERTDRTLGGIFEKDGLLAGWFADGKFPATWFQSINPAAILVFGPIFAWIWIRLEQRNHHPSSPLKFCCGLYILGLAFLAMVLGSATPEDGSLAGPQWLLITYVVCTWGELCLSPVGLSLVTKLVPPKLQSLMMGIWFATTGVGNFFGSKLAVLSTRFDDEKATFILPGLPGFFLLLVIAPIILGVFLTLLSPLLKRMMHGAE